MGFTLLLWVRAQPAGSASKPLPDATKCTPVATIGPLTMSMTSGPQLAGSLSSSSIVPPARQGAETELEQLVEEFKRLALSASLKESQLAASQIMAVVAELGGRAPADGTLALLNGDHESSWLYSKRRLALLNLAMPRDCPATW